MKTMTSTLTIQPDGSITFIHSDDLTDVLDLGAATIRRASHVEPIGKEWFADLSPVHGPVLGPFRLRSEALTAEVAWLENEMQNGPLPAAC